MTLLTSHSLAADLRDGHVASAAEVTSNQAETQVEPLVPVDVAQLRAEMREQAVLMSYAITIVCFVLVVVFTLRRFAGAKQAIKDKAKRDLARAERKARPSSS